MTDLTVRKFCIPIQPDYHRRLFPEIAFATELPLFPAGDVRPDLTAWRGRTPGNTIRKVYLCRAKTTRIRPGDILFFYMSKDDSYAASQSIGKDTSDQQINGLLVFASTTRNSHRNKLILLLSLNAGLRAGGHRPART